jgi:cytochrome d ubiquinol oxidase subunit I
MQHPVGYVMKNGRPVLSDFLAVVTQEFAILAILHTLFAAYVVAGFFVMAVSAYQISRKQFPGFFEKSFRMGLVFASIFTLLVIIEGHMHGANLVETQPAKLAALETHWVTQARAPVYIFALPNLHGEGNSIEMGAIPGVMSLLAHHSFDATVKGLFDIPPDERPPVLATFASFRIMVGIGMFLLAVLAAAWYYSGRLKTSPLFLRFMAFSLPLPYLACLFGWTVAEVGRQPWIVYGLMKTARGSSPIAPSQAAASLVAFILVYTFIGITAFFLMGQAVKKGPEPIAPTGSGKEAADA